MLVLQIKVSGKGVTLFTSDGQVHIEVTKAKGPHAWLGITAPRSIKILRDELLTKESDHGENKS